MSGQENTIASGHVVDLLALDAQLGSAAKDHHPFVLHLIVPLAGRRDVTARDDAFEPNSRPLEQFFEVLVGSHRRQVVEEIHRVLLIENVTQAATITPPRIDKSIQIELMVDLDEFSVKNY